MPRSDPSDADAPLWIFLHVPKCAGTTFAEHLKYHFGRSRSLGIGPRLGQPFATRDEVDTYLDSLGPKRLARTRLVSGHAVYVGIDAHFERPARYVTFLRDPVERTVSHYNYFLQVLPLITAEERAPYLRQGEPVSFDEWLRMVDPNLQTRMILNYRIDGRIGMQDDQRVEPRHLDEARALLAGFHFVGSTDSFEEDALYLYGEIGVDRLIRSPQNVNEAKTFLPSTSECAMIEEELRFDRALYEDALRWNAEFRARTPGFAAQVERVRSESRFVRPLRTEIQAVVTRLLGPPAVTRLRRVLGPWMGER